MLEESPSASSSACRQISSSVDVALDRGDSGSVISLGRKEIFEGPALALALAAISLRFGGSGFVAGIRTVGSFP